jgi:transposase
MVCQLEEVILSICLVLDGNSQRQAARHFGVAPQSVANWLKQYADDLPETLPGLETLIKVAEQDELFMLIGDKKTKSIS